MAGAAPPAKRLWAGSQPGEGGGSPVPGCAGHSGTSCCWSSSPRLTSCREPWPPGHPSGLAFRDGWTRAWGLGVCRAPKEGSVRPQGLRAPGRGDFLGCTVLGTAAPGEGCRLDEQAWNMRQPHGQRRETGRAGRDMDGVEAEIGSWQTQGTGETWEQAVPARGVHKGTVRRGQSRAGHAPGGQTGREELRARVCS